MNKITQILHLLLVISIALLPMRGVMAGFCAVSVNSELQVISQTIEVHSHAASDDSLVQETHYHHKMMDANYSQNGNHFTVCHSEKMNHCEICTISFSLLNHVVVGGFSQKNDVEEAKNTIKEFKEKDPDLDKFFSSAVGYAVFPGIGKGGLGIGGAAGKGTLFKGGTAVADVKMTQVTLGLQAGGQKYAEIVFFETAEDYEDFLSGNYEFAAQVSAVALASGASADAAYKNGILVFTMSIGGLMYEASLGGQKFKVTPF